jgi:hypothetical protein
VTYLRFNLPSATITSGQLQITANLLAGYPETAIYMAIYGAASSSWSQSTVDWATAPAIGAAPLATSKVSGLTPTALTFNLTSYLAQQQAAGATAVTLVLQGMYYTSGFIAVAGQATANAPALLLATASTPIVAATPAPTPS